MSGANYYEQFNNIIDMLDHCGASLGEDEGIINKVLESSSMTVSTATAILSENAHIEAQEWYYGLAFLMGADHIHFGCYLEDLENDFTQGVDQYLWADAHHVLANWKQDPCNLVQLTSGHDSIQFANIATDHETMNMEQVKMMPSETQPNDKQGTTCTTHGELSDHTSGRGLCHGGRQSGGHG